MKLVLRQPHDLATDYEFIFGFLVIPLGGAVYSLLLCLPMSVHFFCMFYHLTGIPCPACGSFRCAKQLMSGHFLESFLLQPLVVLVVMACVAVMLYSWIVVIGRLPRLRMEGVTRRQKKAFLFMIVTLVIANWIYVLFTLS